MLLLYMLLSQLFLSHQHQFMQNKIANWSAHDVEWSVSLMIYNVAAIDDKRIHPVYGKYESWICDTSMHACCASANTRTALPFKHCLTATSDLRRVKAQLDCLLTYLLAHSRLIAQPHAAATVCITAYAALIFVKSKRDFPQWLNAAKGFLGPKFPRDAISIQR